MKRPSPRTFSFVALASVCSGGFAALVGSVAGGCVYSNNTNPVASVCGAIGGYAQTCAVASGCQAAVVRDCSKVTLSLSSAAFNAIFDCATAKGATCENASSPLTSPCVVTDFPEVGAATSADQPELQLAADYCRACAPTDPECTTTFYAGFTAADGGKEVPAAALAGDQTLQTVDSTCIPMLSADAGVAACEAAFTACAAPILAAGIYFPPECTATGPHDGG